MSHSWCKSFFFPVSILVYLLASGCSSGSPKSSPISTLPPVQAPSGSPTVSTSTLTFPATQVGVFSAVQTVSVISPSGAAVSAKSSLPAVFSLPGTTSCAASASSCQIAVSFQPAAVGVISGQLVITDANGLTAAVALSGSGFIPAIAPSISTTQIGFGTQTTGQTSAVQIITVTAQNADAITATSSNPSTFPLTGANCPQGAASCQIGVSFHPTVVGGTSAQVLITDSNGLSAIVSVSGSGIAPLVAPTVSTTSISFGLTATGRSATAQLVTVVSQNQDAVVVQSSSPSVFKLPLTTSCPQGAVNCTIAVVFTPNQAGSATGRLTVTDSNGLSTAVSLSGLGFVPSSPGVSTTALDFGRQEIGIPGTSQTLLVLPQNADPITASLVNTGDFTVTTDPSCGLGAPTCRIEVGFNPSTNGSVSTSIVLNDPINALTSNVTVTGIGYGNIGAMSALAYYLPLTEGSGYVLQDISGNGKNGTISGTGTTAVWGNGAGLQLNGQSATIPLASGLPTLGYCAYFPAATASAFSNYIYVLSSVVNGQNGYNLGTSYGPGTDHGNYAYFPKIGRSNGEPSTLAINGLTGNHCIQTVIGDSGQGTLDKLFIDGIEATYLRQGITDDTLGGGQLTNNIVLQDNGPIGFRMPISLYSVWGGTLRDTPQQAMARAKSEIARLKLSGVQFGYQVLPDLDSSCSITGTSLDQGFMASHPTSELLNLDFSCSLHDFSVSGQPSKDMTAGYEDREATVYHPKAARNIAFNGGPTNGVVKEQESPQNAFQDLLDWNTLAHSQGWKTVVETMTSRCGNDGYMGLSGDTLKQQYNTLLLANADVFDWVIDQAAAPQIGADNACNNPVYFADASTGIGTHFTDAGQAFYVAAERAGFEGVYRSTQTLINGSYTQLPSDTQILASGSKAYTVNLMDANTGNFNKYGEVCVQNQGTAVVTLVPVQGQTVGGSPTLQVASGMISCIKPSVADPTTGGAVWSVVP